MPNGPLRISIISPPPNLSGGERVVAVYAKKLLKRGHQVQIVCYQPTQRSWRAKVKNVLRGKGWPPQREIGDSHYADYGVDYRVVDHAGPITASDVPDGDVVIATFWTTAAVAANLPPSKGRAVYFVQHDEAQVHGMAEAVETTYQLPMPHICVSQWVASAVRSRHPGVQQTVINNAVEVDRFPRADSDRDRRVVGFMYSTIPFKGADIALESLRRARQSEPLQVRALGANFPDALPDWLDRCERPASVELAQLYGQCRVWLFPSRIEGFGLPLLEAMACGTPVIGTPAGAAPELIDQGGGILVPHEDPAAMAEAILRVVRMNDDEWQAMSDAAFRTAASYTWDAATDLFEAALLQAASSHAGITPAVKAW